VGRRQQGLPKDILPSRLAGLGPVTYYNSVN
jgi:hypothetical protein